MNCWLRNSILLSSLSVSLNSCSSDNTDAAKQPGVRLNADSTALLITGLDHELFTEIGAEPADSTAWESLFGLFKETPNTDLQGLEPAYPGKYRVSGDVLIFTPDSGFQRGNHYRAELNIPEPFSEEEITGRAEPPGNTKPREFRFIF